MAIVAPYLIRVVGVAELAMGVLLAFNRGSWVGFMYALGAVVDP